MPIPDFNQYGWLPEGRFDTTREEINGRYLQNPNRSAIWMKFEQFMAEVAALPWAASIQAYFLDGGFTSNKPATKDIDVVLDLSGASDAVLWDAVTWITTHQPRVMSDYQVDLYPYHPRMPNNLIGFFQYVKEDERIRKGAPMDIRKGLLVFRP